MTSEIKSADRTSGRQHWPR